MKTVHVGDVVAAAFSPITHPLPPAPPPPPPPPPIPAVALGIDKKKKNKKNKKNTTVDEEDKALTHDLFTNGTNGSNHSSGIKKRARHRPNLAVHVECDDDHVETRYTAKTRPTMSPTHICMTCNIGCSGGDGSGGSGSGSGGGNGAMNAAASAAIAIMVDGQDKGNKVDMSSSLFERPPPPPPMSDDFPTHHMRPNTEDSLRRRRSLAEAADRQFVTQLSRSADQETPNRLLAPLIPLISRPMLLASGPPPLPPLPPPDYVMPALQKHSLPWDSSSSSSSALFRASRYPVDYSLRRQQISASLLIHLSPISSVSTTDKEKPILSSSSRCKTLFSFFAACRRRPSPELNN